MLLNEILDFLSSKKNGQFFHIVMETTKKPNKDNKDKVLTKRTSVVNRIGQKYVSANTNDTLQTPSQYEVIVPYRLKAKIDKEGIKQYYLEVHTIDSQPKVNYFINGKEVSKNEFNACLTPSEANKTMGVSDYYIVNIKNIISLV